MIKKVIIKNFKSIQNLEIDLNPGVTVITGMNNSGKTNLMEAINVLVNDDYYPSKVNECFYFDSQNEADFFEISAIIKIENFDNWINNSNNLKICVHENNIDKCEWYFKDDIKNILTNIEFTVTKKLSKNDSKYYEETIFFKYKKHGINEIDCFFKGYSFLSMVYPGAGLGTDKSAKNSLSSYKSAWFGKLIDSVINEEIKTKISGMNKTILENEDFVKLEEEITEGFFGSQQNLIPSILGIKKASISYIPSNRNIRTSFDVKIDDGKEEKIENKSTGTQFVTVIELFLNYMKIFNKNGILSIDEIESTLHPSIAKKVVSIASKEVKQLIFTTHSKDLLKIVPFANIIKVEKKNVQTEVQIIKNIPLKLYPLIYQWPEVFFNDQLIISEGKESSLIEAFIADNKELSKKAASLNLEVINGEGTGVTGLLKHIKSINYKITCYFIYDAEYLFKNIKTTIKMAEFNGAKKEDILFIKSNSSFEEKIKFLEKFKIFIMSKKNENNKGGVELYYKSSPELELIDIKERPLFLASKVLNGHSIDDIFDSTEYLEVIKKILIS